MQVQDVVADLPQRFTYSDRLKEFPVEKSRAIIAMFTKGDAGANAAAVESRFGAVFGKVTSMDATDGVRITFESGDVVHLRPSGNAPEFRCYTEASSDDDAVGINGKAMTILREIAGTL